MGGLQKLVVGRDPLDGFGRESTLQDGQEGFLVDRFHNRVRVSFVTMGKLNVVESDAPFSVVLFEGVGFGLEVEDNFVLGHNFCLERGCLGIGLLEKFLQGGDFAGEGFEGFKFLSEGVQDGKFGHDGVFVCLVDGGGGVWRHGCCSDGVVWCRKGGV